jgi:DNA helicase-2/ATP-dependent DNA helicase PcrA
MSIFPLDNYQKLIVDSDDTNIVVIAGAGSGKTRVLTERIKHLLDKGVKPSSIVAFTFTVMAAEELKERLSDIPGSDEMFIGTIHSYANFILRHYSNVQYELLTDELEHDIMLDLCKHNKILPVTTSIYNAFKSRHYDGGEVYNYITTKYGFKVSEALRHILEFDSNDRFPITIKSIARINNYITFDKLIELATEYFETTGNFVDYLFVDEFQDIGNLEYKFIASLQALSYFIVGDDYQSIYGFKGANPRYFQQLTKKSGWSVYELINNYRCGKNILNYANSYIDECKNVIKKETKSVTNYLGSCHKFYHLNEIIKIIKNKSKGNYKDWFLLFRTNKEIETCLELLKNNDVPCTTFKKSKLTTEEKQALMEEDTVKVLTIHTSKGLENKNVVLYYPPNKLYIPDYRRCDDDDIFNEEEVRLYYVGCTRAEENLYVL